MAPATAPEIPVPQAPEPDLPVNEPPGIEPPLTEPPVAPPPEIEPPQTDAPPVIDPPVAVGAVAASSSDALPPATTDAPVPLAHAPAAPPIPEMSPAACAARLAEMFPAVFTAGTFRPLKLRIQVDVQQRAPALFTRRVLSGFLQRYTTGTAYLKALSQATERVDLDGAPAGPVSDEHRQAAIEELVRRRALHDARRTAEREAQRETQRNAYRAAQDEARRQHEARAADDNVRRDRAMLLRAFESSTLTKANFCALKRMTEVELDALLVQARTEREQRPPAPSMQRPDEPRADPRRLQRPDRPDRPDPRRAGAPATGVAAEGDRDARHRDRRPGGPHKPAHRRPAPPPKPAP